jgi:hypothetical protein
MKRPYRSKDFNDERKWKSNHPHDDVLQVGIQKAIGYVCWLSGHQTNDLKELVFDMFDSGKLVMFRGSNSISHMNFPILYVGDERMIQSIADRQKDVLVKAGWPTEAGLIFEKICSVGVKHDENEELYHLIADLFNSWCLWCDIPLWPEGEKIHEPFSRNPYDPDEE